MYFVDRTFQPGNGSTNNTNYTDYTNYAKRVEFDFEAKPLLSTKNFLMEYLDK